MMMWSGWQTPLVGAAGRVLWVLRGTHVPARPVVLSG